MPTITGRWLFIIDGIITLPLALLAYVFLPNLPQGGKKTWWITEKEHELSVKRMEVVGRAGKQKWTKAKLNRILLSWHTYMLRKSFSSSISGLGCKSTKKTNVEAVSIALHSLEQRKCTKRHGLLVEELQQQPSTGTGETFQCCGD